MTNTEEENIEAQWEKFFQNIKTYAGHESLRWNRMTLLSYFMVKYENIKKTPYILKSGAGSPNKTKEMRDASKIWTALERGTAQFKQNNTADEYKVLLVELLKEYIDWALEIKMYNKLLTSLGLLTDNKFMNEFFQYRSKKIKAQKSRSAPIPAELIDWITKNAPGLFNKYQFSILIDLNMLVKYTDENKELNDKSIELIVVNKARELNILPKEGKLELSK